MSSNFRRFSATIFVKSVANNVQLFPCCKFGISTTCKSLKISLFKSVYKLSLIFIFLVKELSNNKHFYFG